MKQHIYIEELESRVWRGATRYPVNTPEEVNEAIAAMRIAGMNQAIIWIGEPWCPDTYSSGTVLYADGGS